MDFLFGLIIGLVLGWNTIQPQIARDLQTKFVNLISNRSNNQ